MAVPREFFRNLRSVCASSETVDDTERGLSVILGLSEQLRSDVVGF